MQMNICTEPGVGLINNITVVIVLCYLNLLLYFIYVLFFCCNLTFNLGLFTGSLLTYFLSWTYFLYIAMSDNGCFVGGLAGGEFFKECTIIG